MIEWVSLGDPGGGGPVKVPESRARMEGAELGLAGSARMEGAWLRLEKS